VVESGGAIIALALLAHSEIKVCCCLVIRGRRRLLVGMAIGSPICIRAVVVRRDLIWRVDNVRRWRLQIPFARAEEKRIQGATVLPLIVICCSRRIRMDLSA
jgi:hypothetical protein